MARQIFGKGAAKFSSGRGKNLVGVKILIGRGAADFVGRRAFCRKKKKLIFLLTLRSEIWYNMRC